MKLFVDDVRECPEGFILIRPDNLAMFYHLMKHCTKDDIISLDHDLGDNYPTGYDIVNNIEKQVHLYNMWKERGMPQIVIHSANPVGKKNMEAAITSIKQFLGK